MRKLQGVAATVNERSHSPHVHVAVLQERERQTRFEEFVEIFVSVRSWSLEPWACSHVDPRRVLVADLPGHPYSKQEYAAPVCFTMLPATVALCGS